MPKYEIATIVRLQTLPMLERRLEGWSGDISLGVNRGHLHLPRWSKPGLPLRKPAWPGKNAPKLPTSGWGARVNPGSDDPVHDELLLAAVQARFKAKGKNRDAVTKELKTEGERWARRLTEWIEVFTHQDLHQTEPFEPMHEVGRDVDVLLRTSDRWKAGRPQSWRLTVVGWRPLHEAEWTAVVEKANLQADPPLAHRLLRDARHALNLNRPLEATLLLGSALEVALRPVVEWHLTLAGQTPQPRETLGNLIAYARLAPPLFTLPARLTPPGSTAGFLQRRNAATHGATSPARDDVVEDSAEVHKVVETIFPLR